MIVDTVGAHSTMRTATEESMSKVASIRVGVSGPVIRATVPLETSRAWNREACPFQIWSKSGVPFDTQWERVARDGDGVQLVELIAMSQGSTERDFDVLESVPARHSTASPKSWARSFMGGDVTLEVVEPDGSKRLLVGKWGGSDVRNGPACVTRRFAGPHFTGWATCFHGLDVIELDLVLHNATPGGAPWFFRELRLLAGTIQFFAAWPDPWMGCTDVIRLAAPRADGKCHFMHQRATRHYRLTLAAPDAISVMLAQSMSVGDGWGVADTWRTFGKWLPMGLPLPDLSNYDAAMRVESAKQWNANTLAITDPSKAVGLFVPWGVPYGGMTGGSDRELVHTLALCAVQIADMLPVHALQAELAMTAWRTPIALVGPDGAHCALEDWLDPTTNKPRGGWSISGTDGRFANGGKQDGAFGFYAVRTPTLPASEYDAVAWDALNTDDGDGWSPHDWQHFVRISSPAIALAQLKNDQIAQWCLRGWSEVFFMSAFTGFDMYGELVQVEKYPHHGTNWGRSPGHCLAMCAAAYALSARDYRERWDMRLVDALKVLTTAHMLENGFRRAHGAITKDGPMFFDANGNPLHAVSTPDEEVYLENAARSIAHVLGLSGIDLGIVKAQTAAHASLGLWRMAWASGAQAAPSDKIAVRPAARSATPYSIAPARNGSDPAEVGLVLAFSLFDGNAPQDTWNATCKLAGSSVDPLGALLSRPWGKSQIDDTAFLIAALQVT